MGIERLVKLTELQKRKPRKGLANQITHGSINVQRYLNSLR